MAAEAEARDEWAIALTSLIDAEDEAASRVIDPPPRVVSCRAVRNGQHRVVQPSGGFDARLLHASGRSGAAAQHDARRSDRRRP